LEYNIFNLPRPKINIILHLSAKLSHRLKIAQRKNEDKKLDIHERSKKHLQMAEKVFLELAKYYPEYKLVECEEKNQIMSIKKIHEKIYKEVLKTL